MGTQAYMSMNSHAGNTQSRQDDMESLAYVLVAMVYPDLISNLKALTSKSTYSIKRNLVEFMSNPSISSNLLQGVNKNSDKVNELLATCCFH